MAARRDNAAFLRRLWALEERLVAAGLPPITPWWRATLERFYLSGKPRLVVRKGRRVFASTCVAPRLAVAEMLWGAHPHLPGTPPNVFAFLSIKREEASKRLRGIRAILDVLQIKYTTKGDTIELAERPAIFAVVTANFRVSVGDTVAFAWCDEVARWNDDASGANPAEHVIGSLSPALATLPDAKMFLVSSPWTVSDFHAVQFERGETSGQCVAFGTTWEINPTLSEADTREREPDDRTWRREYAAIPSPTSAAPFFPDDALERSRDVGRVGPLRHVEGRRYRMGLDQAFLRDRFGLGVVSSELADADPLTGVRSGRVTVVHLAEAWAAEGNVLASLRRVRDACVRFDTRTVAIDQHGGAPMQELLRQHGVFAEIINWTGGDGEGSKLARYRAVRDAMIAGALRLPDSPELFTELRTIQVELSPSGVERIVVQRTRAGHGDAATALVLAASEALARGPLLPAARMTNWERLEKAQADHRLACLVGVSMVSPR